MDETMFLPEWGCLKEILVDRKEVRGYENGEGAAEKLVVAS
jgi:hypothetical protein